MANRCLSCACSYLDGAVTGGELQGEKIRRTARIDSSIRVIVDLDGLLFFQLPTIHLGKKLRFKRKWPRRLELKVTNNESFCLSGKATFFFHTFLSCLFF